MPHDELSHSERVRAQMHEVLAYAPVDGIRTTLHSADVYSAQEIQEQIQDAWLWLDVLLEYQPNFDHDSWSRNNSEVQGLFETMPGTVTGYEHMRSTSYYVGAMSGGGAVSPSGDVLPFASHWTSWGVDLGEHEGRPESIEDRREVFEQLLDPTLPGAGDYMGQERGEDPSFLAQSSRAPWVWVNRAATTLHTQPKYNDLQEMSIGSAWGCAGLLRGNNGHWLVCYVIGSRDGNEAGGISQGELDDTVPHPTPYAIFYDLTDQKMLHEWVQFPSLHARYELARKVWEPRTVPSKTWRMPGTIYTGVPPRVAKHGTSIIFGRQVYYATSSSEYEGAPLMYGGVDDREPFGGQRISGTPVRYETVTTHAGVELFSGSGASMGLYTVPDARFNHSPNSSPGLTDYEYNLVSGYVVGGRDEQRTTNRAPSWCLGGGAAYWTCVAQPYKVERPPPTEDPDNHGYALPSYTWATNELASTEFPWSDHVQNPWYKENNAELGFVCVNDSVLGMLPTITSTVTVEITTWMATNPGDSPNGRPATEWSAALSPRNLSERTETETAEAIFQPKGVLCWSDKLGAPVFVGRFTGQPMGMHFAANKYQLGWPVGALNPGGDPKGWKLDDTGWLQKKFASEKDAEGNPLVTWLDVSGYPLGEKETVSWATKARQTYQGGLLDYMSIYGTKSEAEAGREAPTVGIQDYTREVGQWGSWGQWYLYEQWRSSPEPFAVLRKQGTAGDNEFVHYYHARTTHRTPLQFGDTNVQQAATEWDGSPVYNPSVGGYHSAWNTGAGMGAGSSEPPPAGSLNAAANTAFNYGFIWALQGSSWQLLDAFLFRVTKQTGGSAYDPIYTDSPDSSSYPVNITQGVDKCIYIHMSNNYCWRWDPKGEKKNCDIMRAAPWTGRVGDMYTGYDPEDEYWVSEAELARLGVSVPAIPEPHDTASAQASYQEFFGESGLGPYGSGLPGDLNKDGVVDAADYTLIQGQQSQEEGAA